MQSEDQSIVLIMPLKPSIAINLFVSPSQLQMTLEQEGSLYALVHLCLEEYCFYLVFIFKCLLIASSPTEFPHIKCCIF